MLPLIGSIIGAGASLLGGAMNASSQREANDNNYKAQKEFAQNGLRWKIEDAKAAGIHPMYAVGAPTQSFSASYVGDTSMGQGLSQAGQDIGRAVAATKTSQERLYDASINNLALERAGLENELLRSQIRRENMSVGPAFPVASGGALSAKGVAAPGAVQAVNIAGGTTTPDRGWSNAQDFEDRYGELVSLPAGLGIGIADLIKTVQNNWDLDFARQSSQYTKPPGYGGNTNRTGGRF